MTTATTKRIQGSQVREGDTLLIDPLDPEKSTAIVCERASSQFQDKSQIVFRFVESGEFAQATITNTQTIVKVF